MIFRLPEVASSLASCISLVWRMQVYVTLLSILRGNKSQFESSIALLSHLATTPQRAPSSRSCFVETTLRKHLAMFQLIDYLRSCSKAYLSKSEVLRSCILGFFGPLTPTFSSPIPYPVNGVNPGLVVVFVARIQP